MKLVITMKNPDSVSWALDEAAKGDETLRAKLENSIRKWVEYSEYISVEIDTVKNTARVLDVEQ